MIEMIFSPFSVVTRAIDALSRAALAHAAPRLVLSVVSFAALCSHAAAMLSDETLKHILKDVKVFTYDLAGQGLMPPLESFSMQNPACEECVNVSYPRWTDCNYGYGVPEASPLATTHHGFLWRGAFDNAVHTHYRLTHSSFTTTNSSEAQLFFIPVYPYLVTYTDPNPGGYCGPSLHGYKNFTGMWTWLRNQPSYQRSNGSDHFIMSIDPWQHSWQWPVFHELGLDEARVPPGALHAERAKVANIAKLVVDTDAASFGPYRKAAKEPLEGQQISDKENSAHKKDARDLAAEDMHPERLFQVPYSSGIHHFHSPTSLPWSRLLSDRLSTPASSAQLQQHVNRPRPFFATYLTTVRGDQVPNTEFLKVKAQTLHLCINDKKCKVHLLDPTIRERSVVRLGHSIIKANMSSALSAFGVAELHDFVAFARDRIETVPYLSQFCLTPPGDSVSRKGFFDAILMGCIPVVFYPMSAHYPWHLPVGDGPDGLESFAVYIPGKDVLKDPSIVMDRLRLIPSEKVLAMQRRLAELAPRIQYMVGRWEDSSESGKSQRQGWYPDALDIALAGLRLNVDQGVNVTTWKVQL
jgi:hypothetical protein